ncbi:MAG: chemotaxis protein CheW [Candidatus Methylomirabilales bacterium]
MLSRTPRTPSPSAGSLAVFGLGARRFALPAACILEVVRVQACTRVPCPDPTRLGVMLYRDSIVPLLDLGPALGAPPRGAAAPGLCVVARTAWGEVGFPIDGVLGIQSGGPDGWTPAGVFSGELGVLCPAEGGGRHDPRAAA